jgi:hypothetical protein
MKLIVPSNCKNWAEIEALGIKKISELEDNLIEVEVPEGWALGQMQNQAPSDPRGLKWRFIIDSNGVPKIFIDLYKKSIKALGSWSYYISSNSINALVD